MANRRRIFTSCQYVPDDAEPFVFVTNVFPPCRCIFGSSPGRWTHGVKRLFISSQLDGECHVELRITRNQTVDYRYLQELDLPRAKQELQAVLEI